MDWMAMALMPHSSTWTQRAYNGLDGYGSDTASIHIQRHPQRACTGLDGYGSDAAFKTVKTSPFLMLPLPYHFDFEHKKKGKHLNK
ncbi:hypothetical protein AB832_02285 [Flavobacteriaceae bacterium (ex Bugula neritina AB1)]|nr:hypothetical protein AB832_02285 [Flavobacteriaceae bacterium (ex Bugula neritina AB1)]